MEKKEQIIGVANSLAGVVFNTIGESLTEKDLEELAKFFLIELKFLMRVRSWPTASETLNSSNKSK